MTAMLDHPPLFRVVDGRVTNLDTRGFPWPPEYIKLRTDEVGLTLNLPAEWFQHEHWNYLKTGFTPELRRRIAALLLEGIDE